MTVYKDEKRGIWFVSFRYKDWRGEHKRKSKRGFRTKCDAESWERDFKKRMPEAAPIELGLACDAYLADNAPRIRETTLKQKRYCIKQALKPRFDRILIGYIDKRP